MDDVAPHAWTAIAAALGIGLVSYMLLLRPWLRARRRRRWQAQRFPEAWDAILRRRFPYELRLPDRLREELRRRIQVFVREKRFEGVQGHVVDDETRVLIAAHACLLELGRPARYYPRLTTILVYPGAFRSHRTTWVGGGFTVEEDEVREGESWGYGGFVVLTWDQVVADARDPGDGFNVTLHEFAHQIDFEAGGPEGVPELPSAAARRAWAQACGSAYERLVAAVEAGRRDTFLDPYAATGPAEFFAVVTETFFERPRQLQREEPDLYAVFATAYGLDPATWR